MADEIIKLIEYFAANPIAQVFGIFYVVFFAIVFILIIGIFICAFKNMHYMRKHWR